MDARGALEALQADADVRSEARDLAAAVAGPKASATAEAVREEDLRELAEHADVDAVPLNVINFSHTANAETRALAESVGGLAGLQAFTARFYEKAFADPHIDKFIREHGHHHGQRFGAWIAEKMGLPGQAWTQERSVREVCPFHANGVRIEGAFDRSSAHFAAWHSPKRDAEEWGEHFQLDDCRLWMRLHFWAAREAGVLNTPFGAYYVRFIGHFVSIYERTAPSFARDSARWSADPANTERYLSLGRRMPEIMGLSLTEALAQLPEEERGYSGSAATVLEWPYELPQQLSTE